MFRSKSFNILRPATLDSLTHAKSVSDISSAVIDVSIFITIREVSPHEALNVTNIIMTTTMNTEWKCSSSEYLPGDNEQEKWNMRYDSAYSMFELVHNNIERFIRRKKLSRMDSLFFAAYFKGVPVGILAFTPANDITSELPTVEYLATHCGIRNCGVLLMEHAVNKSQQLGNNGKIKLFPLSEATPAYINMGFSRGDLGYWVLDPANSHKWRFNLRNKGYRYITC
ncbi:GNAT family N-acetyltransferase [Xenorhabdus griffiniae]|uniref:GNAT family N-acetyltransferase n=1 Tax=Xenorhabdus griffiniae TaxID=351672 RepID=A0ABY9XG69_9GAMM|nr:GNAT family N-acetyltransferase [Xenorhabdus griffiniae]MBD1226346.1 GNAT family N-acetyltransferase [Xenorhabdus griffiniae]MBE8586461.1 GNAT family N-acetyltransferase [Xenorhabdus griffiniae]WMV71906.1 GNAT family N-acetyltransferase [Xenorhabdus griffiniae]WNH01583.1 GNAT family N-acetyltransferase [Xenorhabdus griffiniae]